MRASVRVVKASDLGQPRREFAGSQREIGGPQEAERASSAKHEKYDITTL